MSRKAKVEKITKLTPEQKARVPEFVAKWIEIGLSTKPADRAKAEAALAGLYRLAKLKEPRVIWLPCPISAALSAVCYAAVVARFRLTGEDAVVSAVDSAVRSAVVSAVDSAVDSAVRSAVDSAVRSAVRSAVDSAVRSAVVSAVDSAVRSAVVSAVVSAVDSAVVSAVDSAVDSAVRSAVDSAVRSAVRSAVGSAVVSAVDSAVGSAVDSAVGSAVDSAVVSAGVSAGYAYWWGQFNAGYCAWADFFNEAAGVAIDRHYLETTESCGFYWTLDDVCFASSRPMHINRDESGRLHSEVGQSIGYPSGWGLWHWHGTQVPREWIEDRQSLTAAVALSQANVEQRRAACEIVGWNSVLSQLGARSVDKDPDPTIGELLEVNLPNSGREQFLRVLCGTGRSFAIPVPPTVRTALQASAWTYGIDDLASYKPEVRT